jgi:hypothetical protein
MAIALPIISEWNPKGINKAIADFKKLGTTGEKAAFAIKKAALPAAAALVAIGATAISAIKAGEAFATANARVANIADSMGLFGTETKVVTDRLLTLAEATARQIGVDNLSIKATQAKLLTFKNLAATADEVGSSFDRATMAALDMASAGFGSAEQNAVQLGKALEDPIKGITALAKSGITFTASEKKKIEALVKSNKLLEAQDMILQAIEKQIGGTAKATANDTDKMKEGFRQFQQQLGSALLPVLAKITPLLTGLASWATKNKTAFIIIASVIGGIATAILATNAALAVYNTIQALTAALNTALTASFSALWVATGAVVIIAIIAALVALQVKFDIFGKTVDGIKYAFDKLWGAIKFVFDWAKNNWPLLLAIITGPFGPAILCRHFQRSDHGSVQHYLQQASKHKWASLLMSSQHHSKQRSTRSRDCGTTLSENCRSLCPAGFRGLVAKASMFQTSPCSPKEASSQADLGDDWRRQRTRSSHPIVKARQHGLRWWRKSKHHN